MANEQHSNVPVEKVRSQDLESIMRPVFERRYDGVYQASVGMNGALAILAKAYASLPAESQAAMAAMNMPQPVVEASPTAPPAIPVEQTQADDAGFLDPELAYAANTDVSAHDAAAAARASQAVTGWTPTTEVNHASLDLSGISMTPEGDDPVAAAYHRAYLAGLDGSKPLPPQAPPTQYEIDQLAIQQANIELARENLYHIHNGQDGATDMMQEPAR